MTNPSTAVEAGVSLELNREEADMLLEALHVLANCRRYGIKEPSENVQESHAALFEFVARTEARLRAAFGKK